MMFHDVLRIGVGLVAVLGLALSADADIVTFNFDDGTDQGWTNVLTSPDDPPTAYESSDRSDAAQAPQSGNFRVLPQIAGPFSPTEDSPHRTLVFRSPEFVLGAGGSINFFLGIGSGGATSPGPDFDSLPANSASSGFLGVGIRRVSDGAYVLFARRVGNNATWEEFTFDAATLDANSLLGETLTLDLIDQHHGGFGWVALDTVTLNNGTTVSVTPDSFLVTRGLYVSGDESSLATSDNVDLALQRLGTDVQSRTELEVMGTSPTATPTSLDVTLEGAVFARSTVVQTIELWDYVAAAWELINTRNATNIIDSTATVAATGDLSRFVDQANLAVQARIHFQSLNPRQRFASNTDQFMWAIGQ